MLKGRRKWVGKPVEIYENYSWDAIEKILIGVFEKYGKDD